MSNDDRFERKFSPGHKSDQDRIFDLLTEMELRLVAEEGSKESGSAGAQYEDVPGTSPTLPPSYQIRNSPWSNYDRNGHWMGPVNGPNEDKSASILPHYEPSKTPIRESKIDLDPFWNSRKEPHYGNYCGKGYGAGEMGGDPFNPNVSPVDQLDGTCQIHDQNFNGQDGIADYWANRELIENIDRLRNDPNSDWNNGTMTQSEKLYGMGARWEFNRRVEEYEEQHGVPRGGGRGW